LEAPDSVFLQQKEICIYEMEANREGLLSGLLPQVGMEFSTAEEAWMF